MKEAPFPMVGFMIYLLQYVQSFITREFGWVANEALEYIPLERISISNL